MNKLKKIIGSNIRTLRTDYNFSIEKLAEMVNLSPAFIGLIERGTRGASLPNLIKLSKIFKVDINYFITENFDEKEIFYKTREEFEIEKISILLNTLSLEKLITIKSIIEVIQKMNSNIIN